MFVCALPITASMPQCGQSAVWFASTHCLIEAVGNTRKQKKHPQRSLASSSTRCFAAWSFAVAYSTGIGWGAAISASRSTVRAFEDGLPLVAADRALGDDGEAVERDLVDRARGRL